MFGELEEELRRSRPIGTWRRTYRTGESRIAALLAEDVWGVADGGGLVVTATKPTFGRRTVWRQMGQREEQARRRRARRPASPSA